MVYQFSYQAEVNMSTCVFLNPICKWNFLSQLKSLSTSCALSLTHVQSRMKNFYSLSSNIHRKSTERHTHLADVNHKKPLFSRLGYFRRSSTSSMDQIKNIFDEEYLDFDGAITQLLHTNIDALRNMCCYYFDGRGKSIRPITVLLLSRACNYHRNNSRTFSENQHKVALISEMIHISSLMHDDVVDISSMRRGKHSINQLHGDKNAVMAGNYIMSVASQLLASIDDCYVTSIISGIIHDLVAGEFMQERKQDQFEHYLKKTYKKTASLIANCSKVVAHLSEADEEIIESSFNFGKNMGIAFQLVDDLLDYVSSTDNLGKPTAADLRLGLATAPVLFACHKHPDLYEMISRRFSKPGDVEFALNAVAQSDALDETRMLAEQHSKWAIESLLPFRSSPALEALIKLTRNLLNRNR